MYDTSSDSYLYERPPIFDTPRDQHKSDQLNESVEGDKGGEDRP